VGSSWHRSPDVFRKWGLSFLFSLLFGWSICIQFRTGLLEDAEATFNKGIRWVRERGELENELFLIVEYAQSLAIYGGEGARAKAVAMQGCVIAEELASAVSLIESTRTLSATLLATGDAAAALETATEWRERATEVSSDLQYLPFSLHVMSEALSALGRHDEAIQVAISTKAALLLPDALHAMATAFLGRGELDEAKRVTGEMEAAALEIGALNSAPRHGGFRARSMEREGN
jgi:hypothetical protein